MVQSTLLYSKVHKFTLKTWLPILIKSFWLGGIIFYSHCCLAKDYAFLFYSEDYTEGWTDLKYTKEETNQLANELTANFNFEVEVFANLTLTDFKQTLININKRPFTDQDQVFFYFSGHGFYDPNGDQGFLIPTDGPADYAFGDGWISYSKLRQYLGVNKAQHILLALDACHSGSFGYSTKGRPTPPWMQPADCDALQRSSLRYKSRVYLSSGNKDERTSARSEFLGRFLQGLRELPGKGKYVISNQDLTQYINTSRFSSPENGTFRNHEPGGIFVFVHKKACTEKVQKPDSINPTGELPVPRDPIVPMPELQAINSLSTFKMGRNIGATFATADFEHLIQLKPFAIAKSELRFSEFDAYCKQQNIPLPDDAGWGRGNLPVINVSWFEAINYCNWLSDQHGFQRVYTLNGNQVTTNLLANGYRLPTEAEWEYVAGYRNNGKERADFGDGGLEANPRDLNFDGSADLQQSFSVVGQRRNKTVVVSSLDNANELGVSDLSGNVAEWCHDWYADDYYKYAPKEDPSGPTGGSRRVIRGGSYADAPGSIRIFMRASRPPTHRSRKVGFRLARTLVN